MELLVVLAIIISIMGIVLTSQSSFNKTFLLANTAYDIALTLRFTESLGVGTLAAGTTANAGRGVHFDRATPNSFKLFADISPPSATCTTATPDCKPGDKVYTDGQDQRTQTYTLGNGMTVSDFCARAESGDWSCARSLNEALATLDIVFARPNPDAFIRANGDAGISYTSACIAVRSLEGALRYVTVAPSGSITANVSSCP